MSFVIVDLEGVVYVVVNSDEESRLSLEEEGDGHRFTRPLLSSRPRGRGLEKDGIVLALFVRVSVLNFSLSSLKESYLFWSALSVCTVT